MAFTQSDLDALDASIKKGVRRVAYASGSVEYHSLDDMLKLRALMANEVAVAAGTSSPPTTVGAYCSGLHGRQVFGGGRRWR